MQRWAGAVLACAVGICAVARRLAGGRLDLVGGRRLRMCRRQIAPMSGVRSVRPSGTSTSRAPGRRGNACTAILPNPGSGVLCTSRSTMPSPRCCLPAPREPRNGEAGPPMRWAVWRPPAVLVLHLAATGYACCWPPSSAHARCLATLLQADAGLTLVQLCSASGSNCSELARMIAAPPKLGRYHKAAPIQSSPRSAHIVVLHPNWSFRRRNV